MKSIVTKLVIYKKIRALIIAQRPIIAKGISSAVGNFALIAV